MDGTDTLDLWDYRRRVDHQYQEIRGAGLHENSWRQWCQARDELFGTHPQSPIPDSRRGDFSGLTYFSYDPAWRVTARLEAASDEDQLIGHSGPGETGFRRVARVVFPREGRENSLDLFWLNGYGGGVFLPFRDQTNGSATYGGGRYLLDTVKGADLGGPARPGSFVCDFNFAYHPSCVHGAAWSCPLAPAENRLGLAVEAGERLPPEPAP